MPLYRAVAQFEPLSDWLVPACCNLPAIDHRVSDGGWSGAVKEDTGAADLAAFVVLLSAEADSAQTHVRTSAGKVASR